MTRHRLKIFFDGGCRPNPGAMETAVVARGQVHLAHGIGHGTNNDAEWLALLAALRIAQSLGEPDFVLLGDSALVVGQANGTAKCRSEALQTHLRTFRALAGDTPVRVRHIGRAQNLAGIALERARGG